MAPPLSESFADLTDLRRFGLALTRDDRVVVDHAVAAALVERLFRQASMEAVGAAAQSNQKRDRREDARVRAFGQFIRLHRRHARRLAYDETETGSDESPARGGGASARGLSTATAVHMLPLELREALLIVVLAGFSHREAAAALDIPLSALIARLTKARERLAVLTRSPATGAVNAAPHLRVVK